jgi:hypothetical protein
VTQSAWPCQCNASYQSDGNDLEFGFHIDGIILSIHHDARSLNEENKGKDPRE